MSTQLQTASSPAAVTAAAPFAALRVLVAEDNAVNQRIAQRMLEKLGCRVDVAKDGVEALALWQQHRHTVIFMDCQMPQMDGYEATAELRRLQTNGERTTIVALTANSSEEDRRKCLAAGMDDYLSKPVGLDYFLAALQRWAKS